MAKLKENDDAAGASSSLTSFESKLLNLLALMLVQERQQPEQISLLSRAGFRPSEIAELVGTTPNTVSVTLSKLKASRKGSKAN